MSKNTVEIPGPDGKSVSATPLGIVETVERFSEVKLENGQSLHIKYVPIEVFQVDGETDEDGRPLHVVKGQAIITLART